MIDPLFILPVSLGFAVFWVFSACHKVRSLAGFRGVLKGYDIFPSWTLGPLSVAVPFTELAIAALLIVSPQLGALVSVALLSIYALLLGFNVLRGHTLHDCGCSWGSHRDTANYEAPIRLYIIRNLALAVFSALILVPQTLRSLTWVDWTNAVLATTCLMVLSTALAKLFSNHNRMKVAGHV